MSASLVGSEMCIRDSRSTRAPAAAPAPADYYSAAELDERGRRRRAAAACLLYTSDAADDM
eukprot:7907212-Alexandrium_andersonii.AAC.1